MINKYYSKYFSPVEYFGLIPLLFFSVFNLFIAILLVVFLIAYQSVLLVLLYNKNSSTTNLMKIRIGKI
jgi:hypothetical protein